MTHLRWASFSLSGLLELQIVFLSEILGFTEIFFYLFISRFWIGKVCEVRKYLRSMRFFENFEKRFSVIVEVMRSNKVMRL